MVISPSKKEKADLKFDYKAIIFAIIGFIVSWINMEYINITQHQFNSEAYIPLQALAFLSVILTTFIPAIIISLIHRYWAYGYMIGFALAGIPYFVFKDVFIGGYTLATALFIFLIMWLIFWKTWRTLSAIKTQNN
jgi:hypothetical protein